MLKNAFNKALQITKKIKKCAEMVWVIAVYYIMYSRKRSIEDYSKLNIVIIGGEMLNKGAQAMTFTVVDHLKRKLPNKKIKLFSVYDPEKYYKNYKDYSFEILYWPWDLKRGIFSSFRFNNKKVKPNSDYINILLNTYLMFDISGYAMSSQWSLFHCMNYLLNIMLAQKYSIPVYILPQSLGPFYYSYPEKIFLSRVLLKKCFSYPKKIFVREDSGLESVKRFRNNGLEKAKDIVLQNKQYVLSNIYKKIPDIKSYKINQNAVGIIPNYKVFQRVEHSRFYSLYSVVFKKLCEQRRSVYLLAYASEDFKICAELKNMFKNTKSVVTIHEELNAIELENLIMQFDFIVASRYHSVIHAYKNNVPALVIGWANKYNELLRFYNQLDYLMDVRMNISEKKIEAVLSKLLISYRKECDNIRSKNLTLRCDVFDMVF